jgi:hypothetical protein
LNDVDEAHNEHDKSIDLSSDDPDFPGLLIVVIVQEAGPADEHVESKALQPDGPKMESVRLTTNTKMDTTRHLNS